MREASGQDQVIFGVGNVADRATEGSLVRRAVVFLQTALILVRPFLERDNVVEGQEVIDQRVEVVGL
jgi:hypothetical protein